MSRFEPYLVFQNSVVLPPVAWEPWVFPTNVNQIIKIYGTTESRTRPSA